MTRSCTLTLTCTLLAAMACKGGGGSTAGSNPAGIAAPQEISALPAKSGTTAATTHLAAFRGLGRALVAAELPADSDYATARTVKWVNEQALSRFDVLNSIFKALGQTHYGDAANLGAGPYGAMVTQVGDGDKSQSKTLQPWVVESTLATENGQPVNVVKAWIEDGGGLVRALVKIYAAPTQNADGTYADYGVWTVDAALSEDGAQYFVASAEVDPAGGSVIKVHNTDGSGADLREVRGILHRAGTAGYGKVSFPADCQGSSCAHPVVTVSYAYDAHHVELELTSGGSTQRVFKDRDAVVDLVQRYGLFDATGADVAKKLRFGFPFRWVGGAAGPGDTYGYYGAWQGRHQLWANGGAVPANVTVTRADRDPGKPAETYRTSPVYQGVLVKRTYVPATLDDVKGVVVNVWDFESVSLQPNPTNSGWRRCVQAPQAPGAPYVPPVCATSDFTDFASLASNPAVQWNVTLQGQDCTSGCQQVGALAVSGAGFTLAGAPFAPSTGHTVWVNAGGPLFIVWDGASWLRKNVTAIANGQPTFGDAAGDTPYAIPDGRELYLNDMGVNYVVQCAAGSCAVKLERQTVANPANVATFVPQGTVFTQQTWGDTPSTYHVVTDPLDAKYMKLVYDSVGTRDAQAQAGAQPGDVVQTGQFGLTASIGGATVQFNWDWPQQGCQGCGVQQFLVDAQGAIVQLDDPIRLAPVDLADGAGVHHTCSLQFDGSWLQGLPQVEGDLQSGALTVAQAAAKAITVPSGTVLADAGDATKLYVFKQLAVAEYLADTADPGGLDLGPAAGLDLTTVPNLQPTGLGARPDVAFRYSEGVPIE